MEKMRKIKNAQKSSKIGFSCCGGESERGIFFLYGRISLNTIFMAISKFQFLKDFVFFSIFENFSILNEEYYRPRLRSFWVAEVSDLDTSDILGSFW